MMILSTTPPKYPAIPPKIIPRKVTINTAIKLMVSEILPPFISLARTSLPVLSVPRGCFALGSESILSVS